MGALPPSSATTLHKLVPAEAATMRPVGVPPVKSSFLMPGLSDKALPAVAPKPGITFNTPSGRPASVHICAKFNTVTGASSEGFTTTELPAARAGAIFFMAMSWYNVTTHPCEVPAKVQHYVNAHSHSHTQPHSHSHRATEPHTQPHTQPHTRTSGWFHGVI